MSDRTSIAWPGPLFYPPVAAVAVMQSGTRIKVWGHEGRDADCFTGIDLETGDASCMWLLSAIAEVVYA